MRTKAKTTKGKKDAVKKKVASLPKSDGQLRVECKVCGSLEDPSKMHICDCCEKAFHMSCCLEAAWFCSHGCWINKPKPALSMVRISRKFQVDVLPHYDADSRYVSLHACLFIIQVILYLSPCWTETGQNTLKQAK